LTFFVTVRGYAAAQLDPGSVQEIVLGKRREQAAERLNEELPLAEPPRFEVWPDWFPWMPVLPMRIEVNVVPQAQIAESW
jgi:hypothetical protein